MISLIHSKDKGGGAWSGLVTRDCPNIIIPTLAAAKARAPGWSWAWSIWSQIDPSIDYNYLLRQLIMATGFGETVTLGAETVATPCLCLEHVQIGLTANQVTTPIAEAQTSESFALNATAGTGALTTLVTTTRSVPCSPVKIALGSEVAVRATTNRAAGQRNSGFFLDGYDLNAFHFEDIAAIDKAFEQGTPACYPGLTPLAGTFTVTANATANLLGAYTVVSASLADDWLVCGAVAYPEITDSVSASAQFDVSLGAANSEVVQARFAIVRAANYFASTHDYFPFPFIAYAGERLTCRVSNSTGGSYPYYASLYGVKL